LAAYIGARAYKYKTSGLVVIGAHTPLDEYLAAASDRQAPVGSSTAASFVPPRPAVESGFSTAHQCAFWGLF
jgi:hypothetical protein